MGLPPSLFDDQTVLVLDTSTVINLNASGCADEILQAVPSRLVALDLVAGELESGRSKGRQDGPMLARLVEARLVDIVKLNQQALSYFENLVVGSATETLDDGEAATIAYALDTGACAVVDERKANRICAKRFAQLNRACTIDLLAHSTVRGALGVTRLADAVHAALRDARMGVPPQHMDWVVSLIGDARASECHCLPNEIRRQARARL